MNNKTIEIIKDDSLSRAEFAVVLYLLNIKGQFVKGQSKILHETKMPERTVSKALKRLEERGFLIKEIDPEKRNTKIYRLI